MFRVDRTRPAPIYQQIREWIRQQIVSGVWPEHYKLKSELDLVNELGVNRGTLRKAIADLIAEGLLVTIHGRGTFVVSRMLEQPLAEDLIAFSEDLIRRGIPFETKVLVQIAAQASQRVAGLLSVPIDTEIFMLKRLRIVRQEPLALIHNYLLHDRFPQIATIDFTRQGLFATLERQFNVPLSWGRRTFQAQVAGEETARILGISAGDSVMYIEQVTYLSDGSPIELSDIWLKGSRVRLSAIVKRDSTGQSLQNAQETIDFEARDNGWITPEVR
jgi:DNA-binding GntR family transcriptional regulator